MHFRTALVAAIIFACTSLAFSADIVILNDGTRYDGSIIYQDDDVVIMKIENSAVKIDRSDVIWITAGSGASSATAPKSVRLGQAIEFLSSEMKNELEKAGHASVVICPFWGPAADTNGLHERMAAQIARNLRVSGLKTVEPEAIDRVISALEITRSTLRDNLLAGRITGILGAQSALVGQVTALTQDTVTVRVALIQAETGNVIATRTIDIAKTDEVRRLLGEELPQVQVVPVAPAAPVAPVVPVAPKVVQSAVSSKFTPKFSLAEFYRRFVSGKPDSAAHNDTIRWLLDSGNKAYVMSEGVVLVTSYEKLTGPNQVKTLENDLASIFVKLAQLTDGFTAAHVHKAVEFDSIYYGHAAGIFHRFVVRERDDLDRRSWQLVRNNHTFRYAKLAMTINGSWGKLSLDRSYVVSFGTWTSRDITSAMASNGDERLNLSIVPYGWIRWYVAVVDVVTEPSTTPLRIEGPQSAVVEYRSNEPLERLQHLQLLTEK